MAGLKEISKALKLKLPIVQSIFQEIMARVAAGEKVKVKNFGTFQAKVYPGRELTSPRVNGGKPFNFPDSLGLKFRQSQRAKQTLNRMGAEGEQLAKLAGTEPKLVGTKKAKVVKPKAEKAAPPSVAEAAKAEVKSAKAPKAPKAKKAAATTEASN